MKRQRRKSIRAFLTVLAAVAFLWMNPKEVRADAIWEPYEDDFYEKNYMDCEHVGADYFTNGEKGYVTFFQSPESASVAGRMENGQNCYVSFSYTDQKGVTWVIVELEGGNADKEPVYGWVPIEEMEKLYDCMDFIAEHQAEFTAYQGELDDYEIQNVLQFWPYPGAEEPEVEITAYFDEEKVPGYEYLYTDPDGNRWTYFSYYYGCRNSWVCIDSPEERPSCSYQIPHTKEPLYPSVQPPKGSAVSTAEVPGLKLAMILVVFVVVVTVVLIAVLFGKKK